MADGLFTFSCRDDIINTEVINMESYRITADQAKKQLVTGNQKYIAARELKTDVSPETLLKFSHTGQQPYAIIITCSDSRVAYILRRYRRSFRYQSCRKCHRLSPAGQHRICR